MNGSSAPSGPPMPNQSMQPDAPPPYSPYVTGPAELDASKPYLPQERSNSTKGFQAVPQGIPVHQAPPRIQRSACRRQETNPQIVYHVVNRVDRGAVLGRNNVRMSCPFCRAEIISLTTTSPSVVGILSAILCCLLGCLCRCFIIRSIHSCQEVEHHCPNCKRFLGRYSPY